jgi:hypothetical protein
MRTPEGYFGKPWTTEELDYLYANYATMPAKDIAAHLGRSYNATIIRGRLEGLTSHHRSGMHSLVPGYFKTIDTPIKAYLMGLLAADGSISARGQVALALNEKDGKLVEFARDNIAPGARLGSYLTQESNTMITFKVQNAELTADLAEWSVVNRKSLILKWPNLTADMARSYLHGYFDGDGSLNPEWIYRWSLVSGTREFLVSAQEFILAECGVKVGGPYYDKRHNAAWSIVATGEPVRALDAWLQQDELGLARKRLDQE